MKKQSNSVKQDSPLLPLGAMMCGCGNARNAGASSRG